ncbi:unnamed protein product [Agarophyton chilense]|eukprot:gb/GEZJ01003307.1/.p1 GENE.gb/GEZJ01003307.1/~~gb/GEZJ01003307.1/.p1  ORF type:complete len:781 (+),score=91.64 gb/GEZJ01003307.1/:425-2767(+)
MAKHRPIPLHTWLLDGSTLTPTSCHLRNFENRKRSEHDPLVTFRFGELGKNTQAAPELYVPASVLRCSSPPFEALVSSGFLESKTRIVHLEQKSFTAFQFIISFLKCEDIDMTTMPNCLPIYADRWGLDVLFDACFAFAEIRGWPTVHHFMCFALPIMRLLQVPRTFKHVFAARLGFGLRSTLDWIAGEEGCSNQRIRSIPLVSPGSDCSNDSPIVSCANAVHGSPCPRPPREALHHRFFSDEHYESECFRPSPRYRGTAEHSTTSEPSTPEHEFPPAYSAKNAYSYEEKHEEEASFLVEPHANKKTVSKKNFRHLSQPDAFFNPITDSNGNPKDPFKARSDTKWPSPSQQAQREFATKRCKVTNASDPAHSFHHIPRINTSNHQRESGLHDVDSKKVVSPSPVTSLPTHHKTTSLGETYRKGRKRCEQPETANREYALWDAMKVQNMLPQALKELVWFSSKGYSSFILKGILHVLGNELTEDEKIDLLRFLPWDREEIAKALDPNSHITWRLCDWCVIARAQSLAAQLQAGGGREYSAVIKCPGLIHEACQQSDSLLKKEELNASIDTGNISIYVALRTNGCRGDCAALLLNISNRKRKHIDALDEDLLERPLNVSVSVREMDCGCEAGSSVKAPIVPRMFYGLLRSDIKVRTLFIGSGITFTIMDDFEMSRWVQRHQRNCSLIVSLRLRIGEKRQKDPEKESEDDNGGRLGRGKCPCGSCLEEETSGDEILDEDVYSDASDEDDTDSEVDSDDVEEGYEENNGNENDVESISIEGTEA